MSNGEENVAIAEKCVFTQKYLISISIEMLIEYNDSRENCVYTQKYEIELWRKVWKLKEMLI